MLARRPFGSDDALLAAARDEWFALDAGRLARGVRASSADRRSRVARAPLSGDPCSSSEREQAGVAGASDDVLDALADGNRDYEEKFGYIFIVCATGQSADEMLAMLDTRPRNPPDVEIRIAAEEQAQITEIRCDLRSAAFRRSSSRSRASSRTLTDSLHCWQPGSRNAPIRVE